MPSVLEITGTHLEGKCPWLQGKKTSYMLTGDREEPLDLFHSLSVLAQPGCPPVSQVQNQWEQQVHPLLLEIYVKNIVERVRNLSSLIVSIYNISFGKT